jgi:hypothetical protein
VLAFLLIGTLGRTARWYRGSGRVTEAEFRDTITRLLLGGLVCGDSRARLGLER